jgi:hypothetical protein
VDQRTHDFCADISPYHPLFVLSKVESHLMMRVSFDLDDTLICYQQGVPRERSRIPFFLKPWLNEPMRQGTRELIAALKQKGCDVWICTSSSRSPFLVHAWLAFYGISVGHVVTQETYTAYLRRFPDSKPPSKNPRAFGIKLHIDDSEGVKREGELYGFDVLVIAPEDTRWAEIVMEEVDRRTRK